MSAQGQRKKWEHCVAQSGEEVKNTCQKIVYVKEKNKHIFFKYFPHKFKKTNKNQPNVCLAVSHWVVMPTSQYVHVRLHLNINILGNS